MRANRGWQVGAPGPVDPMSIRVLLVDDEKEFADYAAKRLSARGMQVQIAYDGNSALKLVAAHPVDVVVLDLLMPGMDGFQVFREIKKLREMIGDWPAGNLVTASMNAG